MQIVQRPVHEVAAVLRVSQELALKERAPWWIWPGRAIGFCVEFEAVAFVAFLLMKAEALVYVVQNPAPTCSWGFRFPVADVAPSITVIKVGLSDLKTLVVIDVHQRTEVAVIRSIVQVFGFNKGAELLVIPDTALLHGLFVLYQVQFIFIYLRVAVRKKASIDLFPQVVDAPVNAIDVNLDGPPRLVFQLPTLVL